MTTLILLRHGETLYNTEMRFQGILDSPLTDKGVEQAERLAVRLAKEKIELLYCSDIYRAKRTAEIVAKEHNLTPTECVGLREMDFGDWEGLKFSEIKAGWSEAGKMIFSLPSIVNVPNGESFFDLYARAYKTVHTLVRQNIDKTIAVVSHGCFIRGALCSILGMPLDNIWMLKQDNTAYNKIIFEKGEKPALVVYNDTSHLEVFSKSIAYASK